MPSAVSESRIAPSTYYAAKARGVSAAVLGEAYAVNAVYGLYQAMGQIRKSTEVGAVPI